MLDPSCPDITGRVLEALFASGCDRSHPAVRRGCRLSAAHAGAGWKLVRPLGRELYLRHVSGAARLARCRRERERAGHSARARIASRLPESRRRLGRKLRQLRQEPFRAQSQHAFANRLGAARRCSRAAICAARVSSTESIIWCARSGRMAPGRKTTRPEPVSRASSTWLTPTTATRFRCLLSRHIGKPPLSGKSRWREPRIRTWRSRS